MKTDSVLRNPSLWVVFWQWKCNSISDCVGPKDPQGQVPVMMDFLSNIGGTKYLNTVVQYDDTNGPAGNPVALFDTSHVWFDNSNPLTGWPATAAQQNGEIEAAQAHFNLQNSPDAIILVATPPNILMPSGLGCAFHGSDASKTPRIPAIMFPYQNMCGTAGVLCNCAAAIPGFYTPTFASQTTVHLFHELAETIVAPRADTGPNGELPEPSWRPEIGDISNCAPVSVPISPTADYFMAGMWSNAANVPTGNGLFNNSVLSRATRITQFVVNNDQLQAAWGNPDTFSPSYVTINQNEPAGVKLTGDPGAVSWSNNRLDIFVKQQNTTTLMHPYWTPQGVGGGFWTWESFAPPTTDCAVFSNPDVTSRRPFSLLLAMSCLSGGKVGHVFVRRFENPSWEDWQDLGTPGTANGSATMIGGVSVVSSSSSKVDLFLTSTAGNTGLVRLTSTSGGAKGTWSSPTFVVAPTVCSGGLVGDPDAASWAEGRIDVVVRGCTNKLQHLVVNGSTSWELGGVAGNGTPSGRLVARNPTVTAMGDNRLVVSIVDESGTPWNLRYDFGWKSWVRSLASSAFGIESTYW
jgi:hypothetical protein